MRTLLDQTLVEAGRLMRRWPREQEVLTSTLILPILLLLMYELVLDKVLTGASGADAIYGFVPMIAITGAMYGAMGTGLSLYAERESGLLRRFWVLPVHRSAGLLGRLLAECGRTLAGTVVIVALGLALGLRFHQGPWAALAFVLIPVLLIPGISTMVITVGVTGLGDKVVQLFSAVTLLGLFFNSGFVPVDNYPGWLQPLVRAQPMSCAIEAMRNLTLGGPVATPILQTLAWSVGLATVFGTLAVRNIRAAAQS